MAAGDAFLLRVQFRSHAKLWSISCHYKDETGADDRFAANDLSDEFFNQYHNNLLTLIAQDTTLEAYYVLKVSGGSAMPELRKQNSDPGLHADAHSLPPNNAYVVTQLSTDPQLKRSGRIYFSGIPSTEVVDGALSVAYQTIANAIWQSIFTQQLSTGGAQFTPVILRTINDGVPIDPPLPINIESTRLRPIIYTQRPRTSDQKGVSVVR